MPLLNLTLSVLAGFSIVTAGLLLLVYSVLYRRLRKSWLAIGSGATLLMALAVVQWLHLNFQGNLSELFDLRVYALAVLLTAPCFLFFVSEYIQLRLTRLPWALLHFLPVILCLVLPTTITLPLGFLLGAGYAAYCAYQLSSANAERQRFRVELMLLLGFAVMAGVLMLIALLAPAIDKGLFALVYGNLIGLSFVLIIGTLLIYPEAATNLDERLTQQYAQSTLGKVDTQAAMATLERLLGQERLSRNEGLTLAMLAEAAGYTPHQVSELVNSTQGISVSQYLRKHRVADARAMLLAEPKASVLSIGLAAGFASQSTFYAAFKELEGEAPGSFRKRQSARKVPE